VSLRNDVGRSNLVMNGRFARMLVPSMSADKLIWIRGLLDKKASQASSACNEILCFLLFLRLCTLRTESSTLGVGSGLDWRMSLVLEVQI
jgi:hypothetical protein